MVARCGPRNSGLVVLRAVAALAAQRHFGIRTKCIEEGLYRLGVARRGKGRLPAIALTDPDRLDPRQAARADRMDRRRGGIRGLRLEATAARPFAEILESWEA